MGDAICSTNISTFLVSRLFLATNQAHQFLFAIQCSNSSYNSFCSKSFKTIFSKNQTQETSLMYEAKMRATEKKQNNELCDFLKIGDDIAIQIISANDGIAHLGISAPRNKKIKKQQQKICRSEKTL